MEERDRATRLTLLRDELNSAALRGRVLTAVASVIDTESATAVTDAVMRTLEGQR